MKEKIGDALKIRSVLVPLDFSRASFKAIQYALPLAERFGAALHFVHAFDYDYPPATFSAMPLAVPEAELTQRVQREIKDVAKKYGADLPPENLHVAKGRAYHAVCELARQLSTDLIITTTHGRTGLKHVLLGSTAERIVRHAPCATLVVREYEREFLQPNERGGIPDSIQLRKILVPIDFSTCSMAGIASAIRFAQVWKAELIIFHCVPLPTFAAYGEYGGRDLTTLSNYAQEAAREEMQKLVAKLRALDVAVEGVVEFGLVAQEICGYARGHDVDLIIISTHGSTGLAHVFLGSTAEHIVRYAHCPVLVVPSHSRKDKPI